MSLPPPEVHEGEPLARRATTLALFARFTDELLYGAIAVLTPTFRATLGLSYTRVGALSLALQYVSTAVEPINGLLIDVWPRRWLITAGALVIALATVLAGLATTFVLLLLAFALYGAGSGPLAHTADVVLVESNRQNAGRIFARATALDTVGSLLGPALVTGWLALGLDWRWLLLGLGASTLPYAFALARTTFAPAPGRHDRGNSGLLRGIASNVRAVLADREALYWLVYLRVHFIAESPYAYRAIWLAEEGGMSQAVVAIYIAVSQAWGLVGILALERWLHRVPPRLLLLAAAAGALVLFPVWFAVPSNALRFVLIAPLSFLFSLPWPIARSASLNTASRRPGAVTAVNALTGLLPIAFAVGVLAEVVGLTAASLGTHLGGSLVLFALAWFMPRGVRTPSR
jgi:MFS family permease